MNIKMKKMRNEVSEWRSKFVEMEKAAESTDLCKDMKRDMGLLPKYHNEVELRKRGRGRVRAFEGFGKASDGNNGANGCGTKRALDREQSVRNELRSVHARFASIAMVQPQG